MAKKRKKIARKPRREGEAEQQSETPEQYEEHPHPGIPRVYVTWHGPLEGEARPEGKQWYGITFEAGKRTSVEHSPFWNEMRNTIDADPHGNWSYENVVEPPPAPPEPPPEPLPEPEPDPEATRSSRRR